MRWPAPTERFLDPEVCPHALCRGKTRVYDKRNNRATGVIWRRHRCELCGRRWTSYQSRVDPQGINRSDIDPKAINHNQ